MELIQKRVSVKQNCRCYTSSLFCFVGILFVATPLVKGGKALYESIDDNLLGIRDRAILAVYYGCGVRRNEGTNIRVKDILPDRNVVYIATCKNYKERYIPMVGQVKKILLII